MDKDDEEEGECDSVVCVSVVEHTIDCPLRLSSRLGHQREVE